MIQPTIAGPTGTAGKVLAVACLAGFWVLPFSPLVGTLPSNRHGAGHDD